MRTDRLSLRQRQHPPVPVSRAAPRLSRRDPGRKPTFIVQACGCGAGSVSRLMGRRGRVNRGQVCACRNYSRTARFHGFGVCRCPQCPTPGS